MTTLPTALAQIAAGASARRYVVIYPELTEPHPRNQAMVFRDYAEAVEASADYPGAEMFELGRDRSDDIAERANWAAENAEHQMIERRLVRA